MNNGPIITDQDLLDSIFENPYLCTRIASFLPSLADSINASQINYSFFQASKDKAIEKLMWQQGIDFYFPYLSGNDFKEYNNNPKKVFQIEREKFAKQFKINNNQLLEALAGKIEFNLPALTTIERLRILAGSTNSSPHQLNSLVKGAELMRAVNRKDENAITQTLKKLEDWEKYDVFLRAAENGHVPTISALLTHCNDAFSAINMEKALWKAAEKGQLKAVIELINQCNNVISPEYKGKALSSAATYGHTDVINALLTSCKDKISADDKGTALCNAAENGHTDAVSALLTHCKAKINRRDKGSALYRAAKKDSIDTVNILLEHCIDEIDAEWKDTALQAARSPLIIKRLQQIPYQFDDEPQQRLRM